MFQIFHSRTQLYPARFRGRESCNGKGAGSITVRSEWLQVRFHSDNLIVICEKCESWNYLSHYTWDFINGMLQSSFHCIIYRLNTLHIEVTHFICRLGHTKVFFRAGVLGALEDMRDERMSKILSLFQAHIRGYIMRRSYQQLQDQRSAVKFYEN